MSFDPSGTTPGLANKEASQDKTVNMQCRNPRGCTSIEAVEVRLEAPEQHGNRLYRCVKCSHTWGISLGGHLSL